MYYAKIDFTKPSERSDDDLERIKLEFSRILMDISAFASSKKLYSWVEKFDTARGTLNSLNPSKNYYNKDLLVIKNYDLAAMQLLFTAGMSWVFGGMGSWNDIGFKESCDNDKYNYLTEQLFDIISKSILASVNSY